MFSMSYHGERSLCDTEHSAFRLNLSSGPFLFLLLILYFLQRDSHMQFGKLDLHIL